MEMGRADVLWVLSVTGASACGMSETHAAHSASLGREGPGKQGQMHPDRRGLR